MKLQIAKVVEFDGEEYTLADKLNQFQPQSKQFAQILAYDSAKYERLMRKLRATTGQSYHERTFRRILNFVSLKRT